MPAHTFVCFDMDGLLVNTEPMWWRSEAELMAAFGGTWTDDDGRYCVGGPLEKVASLIIDRTGKGEVQGIITDLIDRMEVALRTEPISTMPGALDALEMFSAAGARIALVSASPRVLVDAVLHSLGDISSAFEFSVSSDDVQVSKPDPAPYLLAASRFGCKPGDLLVLEDSPTGVTAAIAAGARVIAVPHLVDIAPHPRVTVISSLTELDVAAVSEGGLERV